MLISEINPLTYKEADPIEQEDIIKSYLPLVKKVVHRIAGRLPAGVDIREMLNSGTIGLVDALEKYDPGHETNFSTYAQFRIRGTILDSFRSQDWVPRSLRRKAHKLEAAYRELEKIHGKPADEGQVAKHMGLEIKELQKMLQEVSSVVMLSIEDFGYGHGEDRFNIQSANGEKTPSPLDNVIGSERVNLIASAIDRLPEKERLVISLYFYEELNLKEIGEILDVTESRASQIRSKALIRLKPYLSSSLN